jgi:hypothetical protein
VLGLLVLYEDFLVLKGTVAVPAHGLVHPLLLASHPLGHNKKGKNTKKKYKYLRNWDAGK